MENKKKLLALLTDIRPDVDFENETALVDDGLIESLDIVAIVTEIMAQFDVEISVDDLMPENFNSADAMLGMIEEKLG
ncbi:MAG: acyl carrier protein [Clostridia bacterium]|nr:acyl carrier protein [Clostridia bacterium]